MSLLLVKMSYRSLFIFSQVSASNVCKILVFKRKNDANRVVFRYHGTPCLNLGERTVE